MKINKETFMRKDFGKQSWLFPMPVLIIGTYGEDGNPNAMNAAWGGIYDTNQIFVSLSKHQTTDNLEANMAFTISVATRKTVEASDYVGMVSYKKDPDKVARAGLHPFKAKHVNAPMFKEYPLTLECKVVSLDGDDSSGYILLGEIVNISIDESVLTNGKVDIRKLEPLAFDPANNKYVVLGEDVADAFKVGLNLK